MEYTLDDKYLLNSYLDNLLFKNTKFYKDTIQSVSENIIYTHGIELIIRPECNQKCDYCYITQHGDEIYPKKYRANNETILKNLDMLLNYFINDRKFYCNLWEIFAGDLFYDNLWFDIIDIFIKYFKPLFEINHKLYHNNNLVHITMPCNCSFAKDIDKYNKVCYYTEKAKKEAGLRLHFSWSHDGPSSVDLREKTELTNDYYELMFNFLKKYNNTAHPMISAAGIEEAEENYFWWIEKYKDLYNPAENRYELAPMHLEVRNPNEWTTEKINKYIQFLDKVVEHRWEMCKQDPEIMAYHLFTQVEQAKKMIPNKYLPYQINNDFIHIYSREIPGREMTCTLGRSLCINVGRLSIVPCHRMAYPFFEAGHFVTSNEKVSNKIKSANNEYLDNFVQNHNTKIIEIEANQGLSAYLNIMTNNTAFNPKCASCNYRFVCLQGCYGAQYEYYGDWCVPITSVCNLLQAKYDFLFQKYYDLGIFDYIENSPDFPITPDKVKRFNEFMKIKGIGKYAK